MSSGKAASVRKTAPRPLEICRTELVAWLDLLAAEQSLVAPVVRDGLPLLQPVRTSAEIAWHVRRPLLSAKEAFLPPSERLFTIEQDASGLHLQETLPDGPVVVFGLRSCDLAGVRVLDRLFLEQPPRDPYYARRRKNTILVGLACSGEGPDCFCTAVGGGPDRPETADIWLHENTDGYRVAGQTSRGRRLLAASGWKDAGREGGSRRKTSPARPGLDWRTEFLNPAWERLGEACLSCRACAYVCPTCRCFTVRDEPVAPGRFERLRCWDACAGANYRRVAGGHRPRPEPYERLRNRVYCKFHYLPGALGLGQVPACTGCGRCLEVCPVGIDLREILETLGRQP